MKQPSLWLSVAMSPFSVSPGSRKWTWSSIAPGRSIFPPASMTRAADAVYPSGMSPPFTSDMNSPFMHTYPRNVRPSFTISALCIIVSCAFFPMALFLSVVRIFFEHAVPFKPYDPEYGFSEYPGVHFACPQYAVDEYYRHFGDLEPIFICRELHFYLECIAFEPD